jgi:hypothetical protein
MDDTTRLALVGLAIPAILGALVGLMGARGGAMQPGQHSAPAPGRALFGFITAIVLAVAALALLLAQYGVSGGISWPPSSAADRFRLVPAAFLLIAILTMVARAPMAARATIIAFLGGAAGIAIIGGKQWLSGSLAPAGSVVWLPISCGLWGALTAFPLASMAARDLRVSTGVILIGLGAAVAAALIGTGSIELGKHGFAITAILIGLVVASLFMRSAVRPMTLGIMCAALASLMSYGVVYSSTPWWVEGLLTLVPLSALLADQLFAHRFNPRTATTIRIAVAATIAAAAIAPGIKSVIDFVTASDSHQSE